MAESSVFDEIRVRRLVVENQDGDGKIILMTTPEGDPAIGLCDRNGRARLQLIMLDGNQPKVLLTDSQGRGRIQMTVDAMESAALTIFHDNDRPWLVCMTDGHRHYIMCLLDRDRDLTPIWVAQAAPEADSRDIAED